MTDDFSANPGGSRGLASTTGSGDGRPGRNHPSCPLAPDKGKGKEAPSTATSLRSRKRKRAESSTSPSDVVRASAGAPYRVSPSRRPADRMWSPTAAISPGDYSPPARVELIDRCIVVQMEASDHEESMPLPSVSVAIAAILDQTAWAKASSAISESDIRWDKFCDLLSIKGRAFEIGVEGLARLECPRPDNGPRQVIDTAFDFQRAVGMQHWLNPSSRHPLLFYLMCDETELNTGLEGSCQTPGVES